MPYEGLWSARRGVYRVRYRIDEASREVLVLDIDHSVGAYRFGPPMTWPARMSRVASTSCAGGPHLTPVASGLSRRVPASWSCRDGPDSDPWPDSP